MYIWVYWTEAERNYFKSTRESTQENKTSSSPVVRIYGFDTRIYTTPKLSECIIFSAPHFPVFGLHTEIHIVPESLFLINFLRLRHRVNISVQFEFWKLETIKYSAFGHFFMQYSVWNWEQTYQITSTLTFSFLLGNGLTGNCLLKINNENIKTMWKTCSKWTIITPVRS